MVKMPSTLGERAVPRSQRGIANIDTGPVIGAQYEGARLIKSGFDDLASGLKDAENALYQRQLQDEERELKMLDVEFSKQRRLINTEFRKTQGEVTLAERAKLDAKYKQAQEQILKKAKSSRVKQAFGMLAAGKVEIDLEQQDAYTEQQRRVANTAASEAVMTEAYQDAAENPLDDVRSILTEKTIQQEVDSQARLNGWSPEVAQSKREAAISQLYKTRVMAAAKDHPDQAWKIYQDNKDRIDGDVRYEIEKHLEEVTLDTLAQGYAEEAIAANPGDIKAQREWIRTKLSGKQEEKALAELQGRLEEYRSDQRWAMTLEEYAYTKLNRQRLADERAEKAAIDDAQDSLNAYLRANPGQNTRTKWEEENPEAAKWLLKDTYKSNTMDAVEQRLAVDAQYADVTNSKSKILYSQMTTEELARVDPATLEIEKANFTLADHNKLIAQVSAAKAKMEAASGATSKLYDEAATLINRYAPRNKKGKITITQAQLDSVQREMDIFIDKAVSSGRIPKHDELAKEAQRLSIRVKSDPSSLFDWMSPKGEESWDSVVAEMRNMSPAQKAVATVAREDIPADVLEDLKVIMEANDLEDTGDLLEQMAAAYALDDRARMQQLISGAK